jgi:hypothetical protein
LYRRCVAARLGIAELLAQGVNRPNELAQRTGTHGPSLLRLLNALVTIGICKKIEIQQYELTAIGEYLAGDTEQSLKSWALYEGEMLWRSWGGLLDSIRTGKNLAELTGFDSIFDLMERSPKVAQAFNAAMDAINRHATPALLQAYDFSGFAQMIDVGGGNGELMCAILKAHPSMRGTIYDLPCCATAARQKLIEAGVGERGEFVAGSFLDSVPSGADGLVLKSIITGPLMRGPAACKNADAAHGDRSALSLHAKIGELTLENDFLEGALNKAGLLSAKR